MTGVSSMTGERLFAAPYLAASKICRQALICKTTELYNVVLTKADVTEPTSPQYSSKGRARFPLISPFRVPRTHRPFGDPRHLL
jgi:hypothetical protein